MRKLLLAGILAAAVLAAGPAAADNSAMWGDWLVQGEFGPHQVDPFQITLGGQSMADYYGVGLEDWFNSGVTYDDIFYEIFHGDMTPNQYVDLAESWLGGIYLEVPASQDSFHVWDWRGSPANGAWAYSAEFHDGGVVNLFSFLMGPDGAMDKTLTLTVDFDPSFRYADWYGYGNAYDEGGWSFSYRGTMSRI